jgi:predicted solute-binding protein
MMKSVNIGIPDDARFAPLQVLGDMNPDFALVTGHEREIAQKLRTRQISMGFVSPYEFGKESSEYQVLPGCAVSSKSGLALHFKEQLRGIRSIAVDPSRVCEIILSRIVLAEQFEIVPAIVPVSGGAVDHMLSKADAALLTGDTYLRYHDAHPCYLDLADCWNEMTELPYVHAICCTRLETVPSAEMKFFSMIGDSVGDSWSSIAASASRSISDVSESEIEKYLRAFSYKMNQEIQDSLLEFLHYAHYHGMLRDIPEVRLVSAD